MLSIAFALRGKLPEVSAWEEVRRVGLGSRPSELSVCRVGLSVVFDVRFCCFCRVVGCVCMMTVG
jgi:hypothetical protein